MIKKVFSTLLSFAILFSFVGISSANAAEMVYVKLEGKQPAKGTKAAIHYEKVKEKKLPNYLTQEEIDQLVAQQTNPSVGFGIVSIELANQQRNSINCIASPTIYNFSFENIDEFYGLVDIYQETGYKTGLYRYNISRNANEDQIAPTSTYGFKLTTLYYPHYGYGMFWQFTGSYDVDGSKETPLTPAYANWKTY